MEMRRRAKNFTDLEKKQLKEILTKYYDVIENKKTDQKTLDLKNKTWTQIAREYNAVQMSGERTTSQLKGLLDSMKKMAKKNGNKLVDLKIENSNGYELNQYNTPLDIKIENRNNAYDINDYNTSVQNGYPYSNDNEVVIEPDVLIEDSNDLSEAEVKESSTDDILRQSELPGTSHKSGMNNYNPEITSTQKIYKTRNEMHKNLYKVTQKRLIAYEKKAISNEQLLAQKIKIAQLELQLKVAELEKKNKIFETEQKIKNTELQIKLMEYEHKKRMFELEEQIKKSEAKKNNS